MSPPVNAKWTMKRSGVAPCQCHSLGGVTTMSPGSNPDQRSAAGLDETFALGDVQGLAEGVAMPGGVGAGREVDTPERDRRFTLTLKRSGRRTRHRSTSRLSLGCRTLGLQFHATPSSPRNTNLDPTARYDSPRHIGRGCQYSHLRV